MKRAALASTALGVALCAGQAAGFFAVAAEPPAPFELTVRGAPASLALDLDGNLPPGAEAGRVRRLVDDATKPADAPGLRRVRWLAEYRGGYRRAVGATQLVGPFQDPAAPPCSGRVVIGQEFLDGAGLTPLLRELLTAQLRDQGRFPVGDFRALRELTLTWAERAQHPEDEAMLRGLPVDAAARAGYLRATATIAFERVEIPVVLALVPHLAGPELRELRVELAMRGHLAFDNRVAQWLSDLAGADRLFDRLARQQLDELVLFALEPPPPIALPGGGALRFAPCREQPQITDGVAGALPFAVAVEPLPGYPLHLPPRAPPGPAPPISAAPLALELDLNALNALLYGAWRDGFLDRQLAAAGLDARFNGDPTVATYLSVRIDAPRLTLPPVVSATARGLSLAAESALHLRDQGQVTLGRVWTAMQLLAPAGGPATPAAGAGLRASLHQLELTCEPRAGVLAPCYGDLVSALQARAPELDAALTAALDDIVRGLFVDRTLSDRALPAELRFRSVAPSLHLQPAPTSAQPASATLRLELGVELRAAK